MNSLNEKLKQIEQEIKEFEKVEIESVEVNEILLELQAQKQLLVEVIELDKELRYDIIPDDDIDANFKRGYNQALKDLLGDEK